MSGKCSSYTRVLLQLRVMILRAVHIHFRVGIPPRTPPCVHPRSYEREGRARKTVKAHALWFAILEAQIETGTPYMLYKDACNLKSNQQHLGTIKSSNLCTEIIEYTSSDEIAVCNLASIALNMFVDPVTRKFNYQHLHDITKVVVRNLNKVIDVNYYPVKEALNSNMRHRPIGLGVQVSRLTCWPRPDL